MAVVALLGLGAAAFPFLLGLHAGVAVVLGGCVVVVSIGAYRLFDGSPWAWDRQLSLGRLITSSLVGLIVVGLVIQVIPFGRSRSNPPVTEEPAWDAPRTRELVVRACFDCHSNEVVYPWYANIAPMSWAVQLHVDAGRAEVNYSEWDRPQEEADESAETVADFEMPPPYYTRLTHADARLTEAERRELIAGLKRTLGSDEDED